ncbi:MAG: family metallopeptidase [Nocardioidaceae bacterium]|nr:family metallopeptidase [Nocardioidaceae bacterium]
MQEVEVRRSRRRRKSVQAYREDGKTIVLIPAHFTRAQEKRYVESMIAQLDQREQRRRPSDEELMVRAAELNDRFLGGVAVPQSIRWVTNQNSRWGSCTVGEGTIRLSHRLQGMPDWVVDYVIIHELAHLLHSNHGAGFWALVNRYPKTERARGFLEGVSHKR